jgi:hypothetical protein
MLRVTTGDQADTPITHILTGIAGSGGTAIGVIGKPRHDVGLPKYCVRVAEPPQPERRNLYRNFTKVT